MSLTSSIYVDGTVNLNMYPLTLKGAEVTFRVHYWGGVQKLYKNPVHMHSFFEICYILDGIGTYMENGKLYSLKKGVMFLSRPQIKHQILSKDGMSIIFVAFDVIESESVDSAIQLFGQLAKTEKIYIEEADQTPSFLIWNALLQQSVYEQPLHKDSISSLCCALFTSFTNTFNHTDENNIKKKHGSSNRGSSTTIYQAKLFIQDNLEHP
jgi:hypothetical protein